MAKNLDGIKKLNPEEIKKYRKIVLNYIGEKDPAGVSEQKKSSQAASSLRRVDGVNLNKTNRFYPGGPGVKNTSQSAMPPVPAPVLIERNEDLIKSREAERLKEAVQRQEEERERIKAEEREYQLKKEQAAKQAKEQAEKQKLEKIRLENERARQEKLRQKESERAEEAKKWQEKIRLEEAAKEEKRQVKEKINLENEKIKQVKAKQAEIEKLKRGLEEKKLLKQKEKNRLEELKKKAVADEAKRQAQEIKRAEVKKKQEEKIKLKERKKAEKRIIKENNKLERMKRRAETQRIRQEKRIARLTARAKFKAKRRKAWKKFKKDYLMNPNNILYKIRQNIAYIISLTALFLAIAYLVFCLAALRLKVDSEILAGAENYLPVPAVITSRGIISLNEYKEIESRYKLSSDLTEKKNYLAKWVLRRGLKEKYGFSAEPVGDDLAVRFVLDIDFNQVGLSRISKIGELIKGGDGIEPLGRYADESDGGTYYDVKSAVEKFGPEVLKLAVGQTGNIMPRANGYYIVERIDDKNGKIGLRYLFIGAETLDQYYAEKLGKTMVFVLVN